MNSKCALYNTADGGATTLMGLGTAQWSHPRLVLAGPFQWLSYTLCIYLVINQTELTPGNFALCIYSKELSARMTAIYNSTALLAAQPFHRDSCDILTENNILLVPNLYNNYSGLVKL